MRIQQSALETTTTSMLSQHSFNPYQTAKPSFESSGQGYPSAVFNPNSARPGMAGAQEKYGQITPPDDDWKANWSLQQQPPLYQEPTNTLDALTTRRDSISSTSSTSSQKAGTSSGKVDKRDKYREKNRVAAAKCRAKKKEHVDGLEDNHRTQSMLNSLLKQTEQNLRDELSFWRTQALQHAYCECQAVQEYNMRKARALAADKELGGTEGHRRDSMASKASTSNAYYQGGDMEGHQHQQT